jgi:hypothetical protein
MEISIGGPDGTRTRNLWIDKEKEASEPTLAQVPPPSTFIGEIVAPRETASTADNPNVPTAGLHNGLQRTATGQTAALPPDLAAVVNAWPVLPEHIRAAILALVNTASKGQA